MIITKFFKKDKNFYEVIKGTSYSFVANIIGIIIGLFLNLLIAKYYGANILGELATLISFITIISIFGLLGTHTYSMKKIPQFISTNKQEEINSLYIKIVILVFTSSIVLSFIIYYFSNFIALNIFNKENYSSLFVTASFILIFFIFQKLNLFTLRAFKSIKLFALFTILITIFNFIILSIMTIFFYNEENPINTYACSVFAVSIISFYYVNKIRKNKLKGFKSTSSKENIGSILITAFPMFLTTGMQTIFGHTDILMLGFFSTIENVGIYIIVIKLSLLTSFLLTVINSMMAPKISELYHKDKIDELKNLAQRSSNFTFLSSLPFFIFYILFGEVILQFFGEDFKSGYFALIILAFGHLVSSGAGSVVNFLNMTGKHLIVTYCMITVGFLNVTLNYLLIPIYGIEGAAFATMISKISINLFSLYYIKKEYKIYVGANISRRRFN